MNPLSDPHTMKRINKSERRAQFFLYACVAVLFLTFIGTVAYGYSVTQRLDKIAKRLEDTQKGNICILLIQPDKRTSKNVTDCVQNNRSDPDDKSFNFNGPNGVSNQSTSNSSSDSPTALYKAIPAPMQPIPQSIIVTTPEPAEPPATPPPAKPDPQPVDPVEIVLQVMRRINPLTGLQECRHTNDTLWQLGEDC